ncbi:uncharacterized protein LOC124970736 [Sciurus carolinensis]|uniref:uncharacterized protein LOC124970736 n=1 Tax=Sciurus carolinensis TaxID=30640 RepID=UPI001FB4A971|nr:uncharacterized protein LOC124970736 [Sciurus carolinensis]
MQEKDQAECKAASTTAGLSRQAQHSVGGQRAGQSCRHLLLFLFLPAGHRQREARPCLLPCTPLSLRALSAPGTLVSQLPLGWTLTLGPTGASCSSSCPRAQPPSDLRTRNHGVSWEVDSLHSAGRPSQRPGCPPRSPCGHPQGNYWAVRGTSHNCPEGGGGLGMHTGRRELGPRPRSSEATSAVLSRLCSAVTALRAPSSLHPYSLPSEGSPTLHGTDRPRFTLPCVHQRAPELSAHLGPSGVDAGLARRPGLLSDPLARAPWSLLLACLHLLLLRSPCCFPVAASPTPGGCVRPCFRAPPLGTSTQALGRPNSGGFSRCDEAAQCFFWRRAPGPRSPRGCCSRVDSPLDTYTTLCLPVRLVSCLRVHCRPQGQRLLHPPASPSGLQAAGPQCRPEGDLK